MRVVFCILLTLCLPSCRSRHRPYPAHAAAKLRPGMETPMRLTWHPPRLRKILDRLGLTDELRTVYSATDPYSRTLTQFYDLDLEKSWHCFLLALPGGSGGDDLHVYLQGSDSTITEVQDFFAFFDTIPGSVHKNYRDLWMDYRTFGPQGMVTMSYVWNGKKYVWDKCIAAGGFPYDTLVARKLIDPSKTSENYPFVDWMGSEE